VLDVEGMISPGMLGERIAADYLQLRGCRIIERNYRFGHTEIDLIVRDGDCLAFVEVKTRRTNSYGEAIEAVRQRKIDNIRAAAKHFIASRRFESKLREFRFDLVALDLNFAEDLMMLRHVKGIS
jgi:putative endonuclease